MAKNVQSAKATAGGGYVFEDYVVAYLFCRMLTNSIVFGPEEGTISRIQFQVQAHQWYLDDALLTLKTVGVERKCAMSLKSGKQITRAGFDQEFVSSAWEQYLVGEPFTRDQDLLCLVTPPLAGGVITAVSTLLQWSRTQEPADAETRVRTPGATNDIVRSLFDGWACPQAIADNRGPVTAHPIEVLRHVRVLECDFERDSSLYRERALALCRATLRSGDLIEATKLWHTLCAIAAYYRPRAGSLTIEELVEILRLQFRLKNFPAHEEDWQKIGRYSEASIQQVRDMIGNRVFLVRDEELRKVEELIRPRQITLFSGPSGCGKSALAKKLVQSKLDSATVVWWNASRLNEPDYELFENKFDLANPLGEIVSTVTAQDAYLVIDGLDRQVHGQAFANLGTVICFLHFENENCPWRVIIPAQDEEVERLHRMLLGAGVPVTSIVRVPTSQPSVQQLAPVWESFPSLVRLASRPELHRLLLNPKILDLFAINIESQGPDISQWTGESDLIKWFWETVVKSGSSGHVRDGFVKLLAQYQADECDVEVPYHEFQASDRAPVDGLIRDRICKEVQESYTFEHELYADWARQKILLSHRKDLKQFLQERLDSPFWHRAMRLLGVHFLEQESVDSWRSAYEKVSSHQDSLSGDLLLESAVFSSNPLPLLEKMWDLLKSNGGLLFNRLLGRFLHTATYPNQLVLGMSRLLEFEATSGPATWDRIPVPAYWPPVIRFLQRHKSEAVNIAPLQVAKVCERWLTAGSLEDAREEAAEVALDIAEYRVALKIAFWRGFHDDELDRIVFKGALESFSVAPDRTRELVLIACGRKPPSGRLLTMVQALLRSASEQSCRRFYTDSWIELPQYPNWRAHVPGSKLPDSWPDGPTRIVDDAFKRTSLTTNSLIQFMVSDPETAREIILACMIASPSEIAYSHIHPSGLELGLSGGDRDFYPPFYSRSPFLQFLRVHSSMGIDLIIQLVDFVTDRWTGDRETRGIRPASIVLQLEQGPRQFIGNSSVFKWYRGLGNSLNSVATALMALENWLYNQLDQGLSLSDAITQILTRSHSVAFLGLLCCVAKKNPKLLETELRPLIAVPELYWWDVDQMVEAEVVAMMSWAYSAPHQKTLAYHWHNLPHRRHDLRLIVYNVLVESEQMRPFFEGIRLNWVARLKDEQEAGNGARFIKNLIARFDLANAARGKDANGRACNFGHSDETPSEEDKAYTRDLQIKNLLMSWPYSLWKLLTGEEKLLGEQIEEFWNILSRISEISPPAGFDILTFRPEHCLAGGAAVLLRHHRQWLEKHPGRKAWCISTILELVLNPPESAQFDAIPPQVHWRGFCAAVLPTLLFEQPHSAEPRRAMATLLTDSRSDVVHILFESAAALRTQLAEDFMRLQHFALRSAVARWARMRANLLEIQPPDLEEWRNSEIEQFVAGATPTSAPDWHIVRESVNSYLPIDETNMRAGLARRTPGMDVHTIMNAYSWLTDLDGALDEHEREHRIHFLQQALQCSLELFSELLETGEVFSQDDYKWAQWLFDRLARAIPSMRDDEHPELFWHPILQLGPDGHRWIEQFFCSWFTENLKQSPPSDLFFAEWNRMIDFAMQSDRWSFEQVGLAYYYLSGIRCNLMGFGGSWNYSWTAQHRPIVDHMRDRYDAWAVMHLKKSRCAQGFAEFLKQPATQGLRSDAVIWFAQAADEVGNQYFRDSGVESSITSFLDLCWTRHALEIRASPRTFDGFKRLLRMLASRQNETAMEIQQRIASGT